MAIEKPFVPRPAFPAWDPGYPYSGPLGMVAVALAYFALGVAVGVLLKDTPRVRRWLTALIVPGGVAAVAYLAWVLRSLA